MALIVMGDVHMGDFIKYIKDSGNKVPHVRKGSYKYEKGEN
jgi:hypothetical protein